MLDTTFVTALDDRGCRAYWVFFNSRVSRDPSTEEILGLARSTPPEVWARRVRAGGIALPDERDRPLYEPFVRQVAEIGRLRHISRWLNAVSVSLSPADLPRIASLPFVAKIRPVAIATVASIGPEWDDLGRPLERTIRSIDGTPRDPSALALSAAPQSLADGRDPGLDYGPSQGQLEEISVPAVHEMGYSGNRVLMMMIDTGFRKDHEAFAETDFLAEWDFVFGDGNVQNEPEDDENQHNHGTGCWGTAGGYAPGNLIGPGYGATFALSKTEDIRSETRVEEDYYVAALEWADSLGVVLTSASLCYVCFDCGFCYEYEDKDGDTAVISIALDIAAERGILCVNAQGNYGCYMGSLGTPADADSMIAVGAVDSLGEIASFSACGPTYDGRIKPEVVARGRHTYWADAGGTNTYGHASGTSLSTPLVAGAAALLLEAHPEWGPMDAREALMQTADRAGAPDNQYGWGRINTEAALNWMPVQFPVPFSLVEPADSALVLTFAPTFIWRASEDPDSGAPLEYAIWIEDVEDPVNSCSIAAGSDTLLTLPFFLEPEKTYQWQVTVDDIAGNRRFSRETFTFLTGGAADVPETGEPDRQTDTAATRLRIHCAPNPFQETLHFQVEAPGNFSSGDALRWTVYDPLGRRVASGLARAGGDGRCLAAWNGKAAGGKQVSPGIYYLETRSGARFARQTIVRLPQ
ncbi:MAG: S8 family serine peptidase [Candidatus Eisenbacteria sp.]|nr:S8 family serine peptidase [Candidatus Eisenbacteria bacterium]